MYKLIHCALTITCAGLWACVQAADNAAPGESLYEARCGGCHSLDANRVGPMHRGVLGRKAGAVPDFAYSPALKQSKLIWNEQLLDKWLSNPEKLIPGQRMGYQLADREERREIIAFLKSAKP